jgi:hypothetical protein
VLITGGEPTRVEADGSRIRHIDLRHISRVDVPHAGWP